MRDLGLMYEPFMEVLAIIITINWLAMITSLVACTIRGAKGQREIGKLLLWLIRGSLYFATASVVIMIFAIFAEPITRVGDIIGLVLLIAPSIIGIPLWPYYLRHTKTAQEEFPSNRKEAGA